MILIYTALLCEAQSFIEKLKLTKNIIKTKDNITIKIYQNSKFVVVVGQVGAKYLKQEFDYIFQNYNITKAINLGVAGVNCTDIEIGKLFITNKKIASIPYLPLLTTQQPQTTNNTNITMLYDMEAKYFLQYVKLVLDDANIFVFKIVSDYLQCCKLSKEFVKQLIFKQVSKILNIIQ